MNKMKKNELKWLLALTKGHRLKLFASGLLAVLSSVCNLVPFIVIYFLSKEVFSSSIDTDYTLKLGLVALGSVFLRFILFFISTNLSHMMAFRIHSGLRKRIMEHLGSLPLGFFTAKSSGETKKIMNEDVEKLELFFAHHLPEFFTGVSTPLLTLLFLFFVDWRLSLAAMIPLPLAFYFRSLILRGYESDVDIYHDNIEQMNNAIVEYIKAMPVIKAFNQTVYSFKRYNDSVVNHTTIISAWVKKITPYYALFKVTIEMAILFILPLGLWLFMGGKAEIHVLILFIMLAPVYLQPVNDLFMITSQLSQLFEGTSRIRNLLDVPPMEKPAEYMVPAGYNIDFVNVGFSYDENETLKNVSFSMAEDTLTAFVGPSGAGKTTAAQLITRFWDIQCGEILIGGVNIKNIHEEKLSEIIAFVFQDVFLLDGTVAENIRMGNLNITDKDVTAAARAASAHDFIMEMDDGYDTVIGERGAFLSGGERQRIAIARAIVKDAPVIILDEATAFADPENESNIQTGLSRLMSGKTVIVIAHRLSTITGADKIIVFENGKINSEGTHNGLLEKSDLYTKMWNEHMQSHRWSLPGKISEVSHV